MRIVNVKVAALWFSLWFSIVPGPVLLSVAGYTIS